MANIIEQVNVGGVVYNIASTAYAVSSTAANEAAKVVTMDGFVLNTGVTIHIKFANGNTAANPTLTISGTGTDAAANNPIPIIGHADWTAGAVFALTYDGTNWVQDYDKLVANNITGSGTSGYLTKFNGTNTITNGPQLGSDATKFLNNKGEWAVPAYTTNTDEKVKQSPITATTSAEYNILLKNSTGNTEETNGVKFASNTSKQVTINPSTGKITAPGGLAGNASSATAFSSAASVSLSGDVSGSASSTKGWSITTTIGEGKVTNAMLAGSIANGKLANSAITIAGQSVSLGSSIDAATLRSKLGLTQALRFVGSTSTTMSDGYTGTPAGISIYTGTGAVAPAVGDVVLDSASNSEYVCISVSGTTYTWEILGSEGSWALDNAVVHNTLLSAKGDIMYASAANTPARLAIGSNGQVLKVNSSGLPVWSTDSDTKVTQAYSTTDGSYPILLSATAGITSTSSRGATTAIVNNAIYVNPSTGTISATKFSGDGSGLSNVTASSVAWSNITGKKFAELHVNATAGGSTTDAAATSNPYIHLYDNEALKSTLQLKGGGGVTISSDASKIITISSLKYKSSGSANALTSLKLKYTDTSAHDDTVSNAAATPTALGTVTNAILYIKSIYYGTTSVSTGVTTA